MSKKHDNLKSYANSVTILWSIIIALLCFLISNYFDKPWANHDNLRIILVTLLSTLAGACIANVAWEVIAKRRFAQQLINLVNISENINNSGIETIYENFLRIDWRKELENSKLFYVVFTYGETWRNSNRDLLKSFIEKGNEIRVILPDPNKEENMKELDKRFQYESGSTKKKIESAISFFVDIGANVMLFEDTLQCSYYKTESFCFMSFFNHMKRKGEVPAIKARNGGAFHTYISSEILAIQERSTKLQ